MVKIADRENWKSSSWVRAHTMNQHKRRGELVVVPTRDHIHHSCSMFNGIVPEGARHLFLREISARHIDHDLLVRFYQSISRLAPSGAGYDGGTLEVQERPNVTPEELLVAITPKLTSEIPGLSAKGKKC